MSNHNYDVEHLIGLLGLGRDSPEIESFIEEFGGNAIFREDKEDGGDSEVIEFNDYGFWFYFQKDRLFSVILNSSDKDPLKYPHQLPLGISFSQSKTEVLNILGEPFSYGGGKSKFFGGEIPDWVKYPLNGKSLHLEFSKDLNRIQHVTIDVILN